MDFPGKSTGVGCHCLLRLRAVVNSKITADGDCSHEIKTLAPWKKSYDQLSILKSTDIYFANKCPPSQSYGFSNNHVWMWELDYKESWAPENWCFWTVVLEKTLESPLNHKEMKPINPKGNQSWISLEGLMLKLKLQYFGQSKELTHWKRPWCWERLKAGGEGDNRGWDGWMTSPTQWTWLWVSSRRCWKTGKLVCCSPWGHKESDMTEWLNWTELRAVGLNIISQYSWSRVPDSSHSLCLCGPHPVVFSASQSQFWSSLHALPLCALTVLEEIFIGSIWSLR